MGRLPYVTIISILLSLISSGPIDCSEQKPTQPETTLELRIKANNKIVEDGQSVSLSLDESVQLQVEIVHPDGNVSDVTNDPKTGYFSPTPWVLSVNDAGLVTATFALAQKFLYTVGVSNTGIVVITYGSKGDEEVGAASVIFEISREPEDPEAPGFYVTAPKTTLRVGETVQLKVIEKLPDGSTRDLADQSTGTTYFTTDEFRLVPEPDGRVTCTGVFARKYKRASIGVRNGQFHDWVKFNLQPGGPGPGLEVVPDKSVLHVGGKTQIHVYKPLSDGGRREVTATSTGTRYLIFPGFGRHDPSVISIDDSGLASATDSIGRYARRTVVVFVRNGDSVGWTKMKVLPANR